MYCPSAIAEALCIEAFWLEQSGLAVVSEWRRKKTEDALNVAQPLAPDGPLGLEFVKVLIIYWDFHTGTSISWDFTENCPQKEKISSELQLCAEKCIEVRGQRKLGRLVGDRAGNSHTINQGLQPRPREYNPQTGRLLHWLFGKKILQLHRPVHDANMRLMVCGVPVHSSWKQHLKVHFLQKAKNDKRKKTCCTKCLELYKVVALYIICTNCHLWLYKLRFLTLIFCSKSCIEAVL